MMMFKKQYSYILGLGFFLLCGVMPSMSLAQNAAEEKLAFAKKMDEEVNAVLHYSVYASGFHVLDIDIAIENEARSYEVDLNTKLTGILGKLVPWQGAFDTKGIKKGADHFQPITHKTLARWKEDEEVRTYKYDQSGRLEKVVVNENGNIHDAKLLPDLSDGTTDILSLLMEVIADGTCRHEADIFDGKRRFATEFRTLKTGTVSPSKYNIYEGPAEVCEVEITPKGGKWHKKPRGWLAIQEQGRAKKKLPQIFLASIDDKLPAVPVKGVTVSDYGTFLLHLNNVTYGEGRRQLAENE
ncbi:MAG: hypothetical protein CMH32_00030 [Micavibrio sp.]|nr:hypothetical protein [Micavibrio sp.]HCK32797.1 hypothetical protein [Rhodospirillaceae bacterium]